MKQFFSSLFMVAAATASAQPVGEYSPAWSPDGKHIAYHKNGNGYQWDLAIRNTDTDSVQRVTDSKSFDTDVSWAPDGKSFVYRSDRSGDSDLYIYELGSRSSRLLMSHPGMDNQPTWSPDGKTIAFLSRRQGSSQLYLLSLEDSSVRQLTAMPNAVFHPAWSKSGDSLFFDSKVGEFGQLFQLHLKSGAISQLTEGEMNKISAKPGRDDRELWVTVNRNGQWDIERFLVEERRWMPGVASPQHEMKPSLSPAGDRMVFSRANARGEFTLMIDSTGH